MKYGHAVRTYTTEGKMLYEDFFSTAERAYEEYMKIINLLKRKLQKGESIMVARFNEGAVMTIETITK